MILSEQEKNALRLLISLGVSRKKGRDITQPDELSRRAGTTETNTRITLEKLETGPESLIRRSADGAFRFTRHPESITLGDVIYSLRNIDAPAADTTEDDTPGLSAILHNVTQFLSESLDRISLGDLINIAHYSPAPHTSSPTTRPRRRHSEEYLNGAGI